MEQQREKTAEENKVPAPRKYRWIVCTILFVVLWAGALTYVQHQSFCPSFHHGFLLQKTLIRCGFNVLFTVALTVGLPYRLVGIPFTVSMLCGLGLVTYSRYFGETMSIETLFADFEEGAAVTNAIWALIPIGAAVLLGLALLAGLALLVFSGRSTFSPKIHAAVAAAAVAVWFGGIFLLNHSPELQFKRLLFEKATGDLMVVYGYLPVWCGELCVKNETELRTAALAQPRTDRLTPLETPLPLPRQIVVVQVETLDFSIVDCMLNDKVVTPFLNELRKKSFFYKLDTFHYNGSADADFAFLASRAPSRHILNYKIETFPYDDALPHDFNRAGYRTHAFHDVSGTFFNRIAAYHKMGFQDIEFTEKLVERFHFTPQNLGGWNTVDDKELFEAVSKTIAAEREKGFFFLITMNSHTPFQAVRERDIYPEPEHLYQFYANSIHYVDRRLGNFYRSLPEGTLFVVYGDHTSGIDDQHYVSRRPGEKDFVPCMISLVGRSIPDRQTTPTPTALSGELTLVDLSNYVRSLLKNAPDEPQSE